MKLVYNGSFYVKPYVPEGYTEIPFSTTDARHHILRPHRYSQLGYVFKGMVITEYRPGCLSLKSALSSCICTSFLNENMIRYGGKVLGWTASNRYRMEEGLLYCGRDREVTFTKTFVPREDMTIASRYWMSVDDSIRPEHHLEAGEVYELAFTVRNGRPINPIRIERGGFHDVYGDVSDD